MDLAARKYHLIEALLQVESEVVMDKLEQILKSGKNTLPFHKEILNQRLDDYQKNPDDLLEWDALKDNW
ncbi:hypothetical protein ACLI1A_05710 [Flavobacterium sp. RHBU_3]|uniref:hypothetical protein n=1 Tax=Flavobacterium sp. RHBU_3 TaxID=3391184 RepID=UPI003984D165